MADSRAAEAFAFLDGAARLQEVGSRLEALSTLVDRGLGALVGRLDTLPSAAGFDPFLVGVQAAAAAAAATPADAFEATARRRPAALAKGRPQPPPGAPSLASAAASGVAVGALAAGVVERALSALSIGGQAGAAAARAAASKSAPRPRLPFGADPLGALVQEAMKRAGLGGAAGPKVPSVTELPAIAARGAAAVGRAVADLIRGVEGTSKPAKPPLAPPPRTGPARGTLPAPLIIENQLGALAAAAIAATKQAARQRTARGDLAAPAVAARAPSRLLAGVAAAAAAAVDAAKSAGTPAPRNSATPPTTEAPREDDVVAAINRMLVDQAWLRGVDLR